LRISTHHFPPLYSRKEKPSKTLERLSSLEDTFF